MPNISKEQIEQVIASLDYDAPETRLDEVAVMMQGLLAQQEGEPVAWRIEFEHGGRDHSTVHGHNAIGDYRDNYPDAKSIPLYRHPAPFTQISADMVKDEVIDMLVTAEPGMRKALFVVAVNAINMRAKK